jgi:ketosteroid isomerase-like protein
VDQALENTLWDVDQQWLCAGPYQKPYQDCVKFRSGYWAPDFFEIQSAGTLRNKPEMVASQIAVDPGMGVRPYPADFKLVAIYGDVAIGTDHTDFQTRRPDGTYAFTADSHCLRIFVKENVGWRPAAAALVPVIPPARGGSEMLSGAVGTRPADEQVQKDLADLDQKWMEAVRTKNLDYIKTLYTENWVEILGWNPTVVLNKEGALQRIPKLEFKTGEGVFPDQLKLMALYGGVALAADRRIRKVVDASGRLTSTTYRGLLVFVKEGSQWKVAADAVVPVLAASK